MYLVAAISSKTYSHSSLKPKTDKVLVAYCEFDDEYSHIICEVGGQNHFLLPCMHPI